MTALATLLTWLLAADAAFFFLENAVSAEGLWSITFIGLFALTIPHVALESFRHRALSP